MKYLPIINLNPGRIMRCTIGLTITIIVLTTTTFARNALAQEDILKAKISINVENIPLNEAFSKLEGQTGASFLYSSSIPLEKKVSVKAVNELLESVLDRLLSPLELQFLVVDNKIVVRAKQKDNKEKPLGTITGKVTDLQTNEALPGVNITIKGSNMGTVTGGDGSYSITVADENAVIIFSYIGYTPQEVALNGRTSIDVQLAPSIQNLNQVVVIGYGTQLRKDITGSIASIKEEELKQVPVTSFAQGLQARVAGVQVSQSSAAPGGGVSVIIRGGNSILSGNQPLYVIDGFPVYNDNNAFAPGGLGSLGQNRDALAALNPGDIESVEILKDASATAIYGSRGANGVVLITTRQGREGRSRVDFESYYGVQQVARKLPLLNAREFAELANEGYLNDGKPAPYPDPASLGEGTDWQDEIFRTAPIQNYQLTFSGGNDQTRYTISGNYLRQDGVIIGSRFDRAAFRINLERNISKRLKIGNHLSISRTADDQTITDTGASGSFAGVTTAALTMPPTTSVRDADGNYNDNTIAGGPPVGNPLALALEPLNRVTSTRAIGNFFLEYTLMEGLTLKSSLGADYSSARRDAYLPTTTRRGRGVSGSSAISSREVASWLNENTLTYQKQFDRHGLTVLGGYTMQGQNNIFVLASTQGFTSDEFGTDNLAVGAVPQIPQSGRAEWKLASFLSRINYNYNNRYLLTLTARADGSSRFGEGNKWGFFPSLALGWIVSEETFMKDLPYISNLKLRASYGITGNQEIGQYQSLAALNAQNYVFGNVLVSGIGPTRVANADLKWETTAQFDGGIDVGLFNDRITFIADYYYKKTTDLLLQVTLPTFTGFATSLQNTGTNENQGVEFSANAKVLTGALKWDVGGNISFNRNRLLSLGRSREFPSGPVIGGIGVNNTGIVRVGESLGNFYGYIADGIFQSAEQVTEHRAQPTAKPGDIRYRDLNEDGALTFADQTIIGNPQPDYFFGFNSNLAFKNFDLNILFQGVVGGDILNVGRFELEALNSANSQLNTVLERWRPDAPGNTMPRATTTAVYRLSSRQVEDGTFLRLRNITLGYNLPLATIKRKVLQSARFYVSAQNLLTLTNYLGYDPEVNTFFGSDNLHLGIDYGTYPRARTYMIGLNIGF
jgi:TonB-linked SusC/RagA family outer membrane protein